MVPKISNNNYFSVKQILSVLSIKKYSCGNIHDNKLTSSIPQYVHIYIYQNTTAYDKMFNFVN